MRLATHGSIEEENTNIPSTATIADPAQVALLIECVATADCPDGSCPTASGMRWRANALAKNFNQIARQSPPRPYEGPSTANQTIRALFTLRDDVARRHRGRR